MENTETVMTWGINADRQPPRLLSDVLDILAEVEGSIPVEYRALAGIDFDPYYDCAGDTYAQVRVTYSRPMTEAELEQYKSEQAEHWAAQLREAEARVVYCLKHLETKP